MRNVFVERVAAAGLFLLLWLYYRWLDRQDRKCREQVEQRRKIERAGSILLPPDLQWSGQDFDIVFLAERRLERRGSGRLRFSGISDETCR